MSDQYADKIMHDALMRATGDLDLDMAAQAIGDAVQALQKQAAALKNAKYDHKKPDLVARAFSHTGKTLDELYRLIKFSKGQPDSRPDFGAEWLKALSDEQFHTVMNWVEENERRARAEEKDDAEVQLEIDS